VTIEERRGGGPVRNAGLPVDVLQVALEQPLLQAGSGSERVQTSL